jgi:hypothetical protein
MQMANSNLVWKRQSDEHRRWSKIFVRTSAVLAVVALAAGASAFSTHVQFRDLCTELESRTRLQPLSSVRKINDQIIEEHCQV